MGAWGINAFENDAAADWLYELEECSDLSVISAALTAVTQIGNEYLEAPDCCNALAAAEIVAALQGRPLPDLPDNAKEWVDAHHKLDAAGLVPAALAAINRVRNNSELRELWGETDEVTTWLMSLDDLVGRLKAR